MNMPTTNTQRGIMIAAMTGLAAAGCSNQAVRAGATRPTGPVQPSALASNSSATVTVTTAAAPSAPARQQAPSALPDFATLGAPRTRPPARDAISGEPSGQDLYSPSARSGGMQLPGVSRVTFSDEGGDSDPAISPDGTRIAFSSTHHTPTSDIYIKSLNGRVITQLTSDAADDGMPAFSPDGARIAFASNRSGNWDIYVMPATGGKAVRVTEDPSDELSPSWSPDGRSIVFNRRGNQSGRWEMWVTTVGQAASSFIGYGMFPKWCPRPGTGSEGADRILFQVGRERGERSFTVWTLDYKDGQTGNFTEIVSAPDAALINPCWSPDGRFIAYSRIPNSAQIAGRAAAAEIWIAGIDGQEPVAVTPGNGRALSPAWAADNRLYYVGNALRIDNIWSVRLQDALLAMGEMAGSTTTATAAAPHPTVKTQLSNAGHLPSAESLKPTHAPQPMKDDGAHADPATTDPAAAQAHAEEEPEQPAPASSEAMAHEQHPD